MSPKTAIELFKKAANSAQLTDKEVRNIIKYLSVEDTTDDDIQRTHELAKSKGWEVLCEHANESPLVCPCPPCCGCRSYGHCQ